eukprot:SM000037S13578  [mRNA]  locus=s37:854620:857158:+ [translate_table: standard]
MAATGRAGAAAAAGRGRGAGAAGGLGPGRPGAVAVLAAIITVHEAGHFLAARLLDIHVTKFSIGFGPVVARRQGKSVEYSLRAIPLGGFVAFPDDDPQSELPPDDPDLLKNRPLAQRALVISAGVLANLLSAYLILFAQVNTVGLVQQDFQPGVLVPDVLENSAAKRGGLEKDDLILAINGHNLPADPSSVMELVDKIKDSPGRPIEFSVMRGPKLVDLKVLPDLNSDGTGRVGVQLSPNAEFFKQKATSVRQAARLAAKEFGRLATTVTDGLKQIFLNFAATSERVSGPVAIVAVGAEVARSDVAGLYQFAAIVNINLAVVNILPLPALDGGYLALILLEALRGGKKLPNGVEQGIVTSGFLLLLAVGVVLMVRDTINLGLLEAL